MFALCYLLLEGVLGLSFEIWRGSFVLGLSFRNTRLKDVILPLIPVAIRTGPVHRSVFAIHTGSSLFLKIYIKFLSLLKFLVIKFP